MAWQTVPSVPFAVPGAAAGTLQVRRKGTDTTLAGKVASSAVPAVVMAVTNLIAEGDSLTANELRNGSASNWFSQLQTLVSGQSQYTFGGNYATGGDPLINFIETQAQKNEVLSGKSSAATANVVFLSPVGINDLQGNIPVADTYQRIKNLSLYYVGQGCRVVLGTLTTSRIDNPPYDHNEFWQRIQQLNNLLRAGWRTECQATILEDLQTDPALGGYAAPLNTTYYAPDKIHYNATGAARKANFSLRALPYLASNTPKVILYDTVADSVAQQPVTPGTTTPGTDFYDAFDRPDGAVANGWLNQGAAQLVNGQLSAVTAYPAAPLARPVQAGVTDQQADMQITWQGINGKSYGSVLRLSADYKNGYILFGFDRVSSFDVALYQLVNGATSPILTLVGTDTAGLNGLPAGQDFLLRLSASGNQIGVALIDGAGTTRLSRTVTNNSVTAAGMAGLWFPSVGDRINAFHLSNYGTTTPPPTSTTSRTDTFERANGPVGGDWTGQQSYAIENGKLKTVLQFGAGPPLLEPASRHKANQQVSAQITWGGTSGGATGYGLTVRNVGETYYLVLLFEQGNTLGYDLYAILPAGGVAIKNMPSVGGMVTGGVYTLDLYANGTTIGVRVANSTGGVLHSESVVDSRIPGAGGAGILSGTATAKYDSVTITDL